MTNEYNAMDVDGRAFLGISVRLQTESLSVWSGLVELHSVVCWASEETNKITCNVIQRRIDIFSQIQTKISFIWTKALHVPGRKLNSEMKTARVFGGNLHYLTALLSLKFNS